MITDFTQCREVHPYLAEPQAMRVGAPGKCGLLDLVFELTREGKSIMRQWTRHAPLIVQQELYFDEAMPEMPCVYILSSGGPNIDGDRYENKFTLKKGAFAHISTGAATKIAEMAYNFSGLKQNFILEEKAYLEYIPEPTIPCRNSRYITDTVIEIAPSATLFYSEIYNGGRNLYPGTTSGRATSLPRKTGCHSEGKFGASYRHDAQLRCIRQCHRTHARKRRSRNI